jgi:hypothetical protein
MGSVEADEKIVALSGDKVAMETTPHYGMGSVHEGKADYVADVAIDMVHAAEEEFTEEQYGRVLRKVDCIILPLMWVREHQLPYPLSLFHPTSCSRGNS